MSNFQVMACAQDVNGTRHYQSFGVSEVNTIQEAIEATIRHCARGFRAIDNSWIVPQRVLITSWE